MDHYNEFDETGARQGSIEQDDVGAGAVQGRDHPVCAGGFACNTQIIVIVEDPAEPVPEHGAVVRDEQTYHEPEA
jgi:hypothetical protein